MSKRGQVSIYIIVGLVILIIAILLFSFRTQIKGIFNPEIRPVTYFVEDCLQSTAEAGIALAGLQGGYIKLPDKLLLEQGYIPPPPSPVTIPFYWFKGNSYIPTKEDIELQLKDFINERIDECTDFSKFESQFTIEPLGEPKLDVNVNLEDVAVELNYPIKIISAEINAGNGYARGRETKIDRFAKRIPAKLGKMHEFAASIMKSINDNVLLEDLTMDVISAASGKEVSMPLEGFKLECGGLEWSKQIDLIPTLQNLVKYNFHFLRFDNSIPDFIGEENPETELDICQSTDSLGRCDREISRSSNMLDYYESFYHFDTNNKDYRDISVRTVYDDSFGMKLDVEPSHGDKVRGIDLPIPLVNTCLKIFHHRYDIEYPIMFELIDENGFQFNFATPVVIENNQPKRYYSPFSASGFDYTPSSEDYCAQRVYQRDVIVRDKVTQQGIEGAKLRYECVQFACDLGETKTMLSGTIPFLQTNFPSCINGFLIAEREGYVDEIIQVTVDGTTEAEAIPQIMMTPLKELEIKMFVKSGDSVRELNENENAYLILSKKEGDYEDTVFYPINEALSSDDKFEIVYGDAEYVLDVKLTENGKPKGGLYMADFDVARNELVNANELIVYLISNDIAFEDFQSYAEFWQTNVMVNSERPEIE